jgi:UDP-N-acetylmuramoyl-L-alanyl-D-glutamate--2,6-diaminopimelate ligase
MVFVAVPGMKADGLQFVSSAIAAGAAAIVAEQPAPTPAPVPWVVVSSARLALALLAAEFFEHPSHAMRVVGITGTNGKTTTSYLSAAIFEAAGMRCGMMGTVTYRIGARSMDATRTTPEAPEVQSFMRRMVAEACGACVMEVSSHALSLRRVDGVSSPAPCSGLTRDHLDSTRTWRTASPRSAAVQMAPAGTPSIINVDDRGGSRSSTSHSRSPTDQQPADVSPGPLSFSLDGLQFEARLPQAWCACARVWSAGQTSTTSSLPWRRRRRSTSRSPR